MDDYRLANKLEEYAAWAVANEWECPIALSDDLLDAAERLRPSKQVLEAERSVLKRENEGLRLELAKVKENLRIYADRAERAEREARRAWMDGGADHADD